MPEIINCPSCQRKLQVPEELIGQGVQCPTCSTAFTATRGGVTAPLSSDEHDRDRDDDYRHRRDLLPHRGGVVLTMGILSLASIAVCALGGLLFGPIAWVMGSNDLAEIRAGRMDPDGEGVTNAGRICGMVGTILGLLSIVGMVMIILFLVATAR
jgi:hypothetical protein